MDAEKIKATAIKVCEDVDKWLTAHLPKQVRGGAPRHTRAHNQCTRTNPSPTHQPTAIVVAR